MKRLFTKQSGAPSREEPVLPLGLEEKGEEVVTRNMMGNV